MLFLVNEMILAEYFDTHNEMNSNSWRATGAAESMAKRHRVLRMLLERGANVNLQDDEGTTALHAAAHRGHLELGEWRACVAQHVGGLAERAHEDSDAERLAGRVDLLVQQLGNFVARHNSDDNKVRIVNLASEFGRTLNGRMARVVGNPSREECQDAVLGKRHARVRVKVEGENEPGSKS